MKFIFKYYVFPVGAIFGPLLAITLIVVNWQPALIFASIIGLVVAYHHFLGGKPIKFD